MFSKLLKATRSIPATNIGRCFQTVRSIDPQTVPGIAEAIEFERVIPEPEVVDPVVKKAPKVFEVLQEIQSLYGLPASPSHIEHLVGRATKGKIYQGVQQESEYILKSSEKIGSVFPKIHNDDKYEVGGIDIANKTQLILQSPHPVRYVIERNICNSQKGIYLPIPSYHTWIVLFGRSLVPNKSNHLQLELSQNFDELLNNIATASDAGMFSADIHHTIMNLPDTHPFFDVDSDKYHMGNKYAVLVGDYFAIRCIYFAERTKTNSVMVAITEGVEEFTTSFFGTNLFDKHVAFPMLLSPSTSVYDWILYNQKAFGYFKGGLYAALSVVHNQMSREQRSTFDLQMTKFVANFSLFLKASIELEALYKCSESVIPSPALLTSLPAILYQHENQNFFENIRKKGYELDPEHVHELHGIIRKSAAPRRSLSYVSGFANETKQALHTVAENAYYINVLNSLIDGVTQNLRNIIFTGGSR